MANPIFKKDERVRVRSPKLMVLVVLYNLGLVGLMTITYFMIYKKNETGINATYRDTLFLYLLLGLFQAVLLVMIIPAFTASAISGEKERQTFDILITSNVAPKTIVFGKLASSISVMLLLITSSLPILAIVFSIGGVDIADIFVFIIVCTFEAIFIGSIGIFYSSACKSTTKAVFATYITIVLLIVGSVAVLEVLHILITKQVREEMYINNTTRRVADLKNIVGIGLVNPLVTIARVLFRQTGNLNTFLQYQDKLGVCNSMLRTYWIPVSMGVQAAISGLLLGLSIRNVGKIQR